jgi:hypothetical protein
MAVADLTRSLFPSLRGSEGFSVVDEIVLDTLEKHVRESPTLEEFITNVGIAAENSRDPLVGAVQYAVREMARKYLEELTRNR